MKALKANKNDILDRMMKESGFHNDDNFNDKTQEIFNKLMEKQNE